METEREKEQQLENISKLKERFQVAKEIMIKEIKGYDYVR